MGEYTDKIEAMSRGIVILDEDSLSLQPMLQQRNIRVIVPPASTKDAKIIETVLPHRIIVTCNAKDFIADAPAYEFGIIEVPKRVMADPTNAAKFVSNALSEHKLWSKKHGFLVTIKLDGTSTYKELKD